MFMEMTAAVECVKEKKKKKTGMQGGQEERELFITQ